MTVNGILNVNKHQGATSFQIVSAIRRLSGQKRVGHAGTLDPLATGVLPVCLGLATRIIEYIHSLPKEYIAGIMLGAETDTYDAQGTVISRGDFSHVTIDRIREILPQFIGEITQIPPPYSAIKVNGIPSYIRARAGLSEQLKPRYVNIFSIDVISFVSPYLKIRVRCSKGTYIRSLVHDLANMLGCQAYLNDLIRTAYGPYNLDTALSLEEIAGSIATKGFSQLLYSLDHPLSGWPKIIIDQNLIASVMNGKSIVIDNAPVDNGSFLRCYDRYGKLIAVLRYEACSRLWHPEKVFIR
jgi:tRNA pseudouridine55 synthase